MKLRINYPFVFVLMFFLVSSPLKSISAEPGLILAVHPYLSHEALLKKFTPFANYLENETGMKVEVRIGTDYDEHIQYIGTNKVDIAYMGPASYVIMTQKFGPRPLLTSLEVNGKAYFEGNIIVRKDSEISSLKNLKGKSIAFGDPSSTMSYIVPHFMLHQAGVFADNAAPHEFLHSHDNVALGVLSGDFDAGAVKPGIFKKYASDGLRTIAVTPRISEHLFVTKSDLSEKLIKQLRDAMLNMKNSPEGMAALRSIKKSVTALVKVEDDDYANLRKILVESENLHLKQ